MIRRSCAKLTFEKGASRTGRSDLGKIFETYTNPFRLSPPVCVTRFLYAYVTQTDRSGAFRNISSWDEEIPREWANVEEKVSSRSEGEKDTVVRAWLL